MRVIAGSARSLQLKTPEGMDTRPTTDRIKETLFNILQYDLADSIFVDLFSGSGGIGIEALSRGASKCYFVENDNTACECIKTNLLFTKLSDKAIIKKQDALSFVQSLSCEHVDFIFMDPPYKKGHELPILQYLKDASYVDENTQIIIESTLDDDFGYCEEWGYTIAREKKYKTNKHVFIRKD